MMALRNMKTENLMPKEFAKAEKELEDASLEINDAKKEVADVEFPTTLCLIETTTQVILALTTTQQ